MNVMPEGTRYSGGCHDNSIAFATYFMALGGVYYPLEGDDLLLRHRRMGRACEGADTGKGEIDNSSGRFAFHGGRRTKLCLAALSQRQRNRLRQAEREWIKQRDALPKDEQGELINERTSYLRSLGGKN